MPILIPRTVTPHLFRQLATSSPRCFHTQVRCRHEAAATEFVQPKADLEQDVNGHAPPLRERKHGFKPLPVSPLMREENAKRPRKYNLQQDDALKEFQKEVAMNPYAQALATPVRFCSLTLARLPSHFLLPFTTTIERLPAASNSQLPKLKARIKPGRSADHAQETLAQTSYIMNRQDMVRHLSRKKHWTNLITDRQKAKLASMAHRSPSSQKLVQDHWVWENQMDATTAMLEREIVVSVKRAVAARGQDSSSTSAGFGLSFDQQGAGDVEKGAQVEQVETVRQAYELTSLLSPESFNVLKSELARTPNSTGTIYISASPEACQAQLALDRLKTYKESNEIFKELPKKQNPAGTREARIQKRYEQLGALLDGEDRVDGGL